MNPTRFDALSRAIDAGVGRRQILAACLTTIAGVLADSRFGSARRNGNKKCNGGKKRCGKKCVNLKNDERNCGQCGFQCISVSSQMTCVEGACRCREGFAFCGDPGTGGGVCTNRQTDPNNCGRCGRRCGSGESCQDGNCHDPFVDCSDAGANDGDACGPDKYCEHRQCIDYAILRGLKFPWCQADHDPRRLVQDWDGHTAPGFALDFGRGVDGASVVATPVLAPIGGTLSKGYHEYEGDGEPQYGHFVIIDAGDGWELLLAHLAEASAHAEGPVSAGDIIGKLGASGLPARAPFGPHIHVEIRRNGTKLPTLMDRNVTIFEGHARNAFRCNADGCPQSLAFSSTNRNASCAGAPTDICTEEHCCFTDQCRPDPLNLDEEFSPETRCTVIGDARCIDNDRLCSGPPCADDSQCERLSYCLNATCCGGESRCSPQCPD